MKEIDIATKWRLSFDLDDMLIKLWDWDKWSCSQVFEGHTHYVMQIVINPKDNNQFSSASLDRTIKVRCPLLCQLCLLVRYNCVRYFTAGFLSEKFLSKAHLKKKKKLIFEAI